MTTKSFEDHFSQQAPVYAQCRPRYPTDLFAYLAGLAPGHRLAWDCGTGNGQAAVALVQYFDRVIATDASTEQIAQAFLHERIEYRVERAEGVSLESDSVDLLTVAVAVHWFDLDEFYREVRRVLVPGGVLAVWTYYAPEIDLGVDRVLARYYGDLLAGYWPERFHYVRERYATLPFPWKEVEVPAFEMGEDWNLWQLICFVDSWSATRRYQTEHGLHPVSLIWPDLLAAWGDPEGRRRIRWPLSMRVGRT